MIDAAPRRLASRQRERQESSITPDPTDRHLMRLVGLLCLAYYLLILGGHHYSIDGIVTFQSAKALVFQGSLAPDPPVYWMGAPQRAYWGIGMWLAYVPWLILWSPVFAWLPGLKAVPYDPSLLMNPALYANLPYLLSCAVNPLITASTTALVFGIGRLLGLSREWSVAAALAYGLASPAVAHARYDFSQPLAGLALTAAVWALVRSEHRPNLGWIVLAGASAGYGVLSRIELLAVVPWMVVWLFMRARRQGLARASCFAAVLGLTPALAFAIGVWLHRLKQGAPSVLPPWSEWVARVFPEGGAHVLVGLAGHLVSPGRGILLFFPLAWLVVPGLLRLARTRPGPAILVAGCIGVLVALYSSFRIWWAGVSWGPRFLVPLLPLMALAAAVWVETAVAQGRRGARTVFIGLAALGVVVSWNAILVDINDYSGWAIGALGVSPDAGPTQFRLWASPLVSGWPFQAGLPVDLFWLRLWRPRRLPMLAELLGAARARLGVDLAVYARAVALGFPLLLVGSLGWAARRLLALLESSSGADRPRVAPPASGAEG